MTATLERVADKQGHILTGRFTVICACGHKRQVTDSEVWFACERPIEPKVPACKAVHYLPKLVEVMEAKEKRKDAEEFIATHEEKLAEAKAVIAEIPPEPKPAKRGRPRKS